jgi:hypothetical protein
VTNLPTATTPLGWYMVATNTTAGTARNFKIAKAWVTSE